jgi:hypothetical protein
MIFFFLHLAEENWYIIFFFLMHPGAGSICSLDYMGLLATTDFRSMIL